MVGGAKDKRWGGKLECEGGYLTPSCLAPEL